MTEGNSCKEHSDLGVGDFKAIRTGLLGREG